MIISHKYRFIFLRTEKTAGSSLSEALGAFLEEGDMRANMRRPAWAKFSPIHHGALKRNFPRAFGLHVHATAKQARAVAGADTFNDYFKFAVERNPWERQVSLYFQRYAKRPHKRAANFSRDLASPIFRATEYVRLNNWATYTIDDEVVVDKVFRYEKLDDALKDIRKTVGLPRDIEMPHLRSGFRKKGDDYRAHYNDATRALVARWYAREIAAFGYEF